MHVVQAASEDSPWWWAVGGGAVAVLLKSLLDFLTEKSRRRREDALRWAPERRQVYPTFFRRLTDYASLLIRREKGYLKHVDPAKIEANCTDANDRLNASLLEIDIIGPDIVATAAADAAEVIFKASQNRKTLINLGQNTDYKQARARFIDAARKELPASGATNSKLGALFSVKTRPDRRSR